MQEPSKPHPALKEITPAQWEEIIDKLMGFTYQYFKAHFEGNIKEAQTPDGATYKDIAQEIVLRVLEGSRRWNPDKDGDLLPYLAGQVKSLFSHGFGSWEAKNVESMREEDDSQIEATEPQPSPVGGRLIRSQNTFALKKRYSEEKERVGQSEQPNLHVVQPAIFDPELVLIDKELQVERGQLFDIILEAVEKSGDKELWALVEAYLDESGEYKPRQISARLSITSDDFQNLRKRLVRCVRTYLDKRSSGTGA